MAYGSYVYSVKLMGSCLYFRKPSITALGFGVTRIPITFQEGRPGLTIKRLNCHPTGAHHSPRSAWVWKSASRSSSLLSTRRPLLCIHWSQTGSTALRRWVVTRGRSWLALRPLYKLTVTKKGSMLVVGTISQEPGLVSFGNNEKDCKTCDSWIGFGTATRSDSYTTCGNGAHGSGADNGLKKIKAMGYILVQ